MKKTFLISLIALLSFSCANDKDNNPAFDFEGPWTLNMVNCFCYFGENPDFSTHRIIFEENKLIIENSGQYEFLVDADGDYTINNDILTLNNGNQYSIDVKLNRLYLIYIDDPGLADDEVTLEYIRG